MGLDSFLSLIPFRIYDDEARNLSHLIDTHFNLLPHESVDSHLATAVSVLAKNSESSQRAAEETGVISMASKKWLPHSEQLTEVDTLKPFPSLKMPPEQEQALLRHTLNATLQHKIDLADLDLKRVLSVTDVLESPESADDSVQQTLDLRFASEPKLALPFEESGHAHDVNDRPDAHALLGNGADGGFSVAKSSAGTDAKTLLPDIENEFKKGSPDAAHGASTDAKLSGSLSDGGANTSNGAGALSALKGTPAEVGAAIKSGAAKLPTGIMGAAGGDGSISEKQENLFIWKARQHEPQPGNPNQQTLVDEPYLVVHNYHNKLQLLPMRSALSYGDNREVFYRDPGTGIISTPDQKYVVRLHEDGVVGLDQAEKLPGGAGAGTKWDMLEDHTLVSKHGDTKDYLQFPGIVESYIDTRHLEPVSVMSNVLDRPEHPAAYAIDENDHHSWTAPANLEENPYLVVDMGAQKHIESMNIEFTDPPKEFLVSGSPDGGHTWRQVYGTDLNSNYATKIPVHGDYTHLKVSFLEANHNGIRQYGVRHMSLYGRIMPEPYIGGYPIFGPIGHFGFEHLRGPLPDQQSLTKLMDLNQQLEVANSKLAVAEEHYQASTDQSATALIASGASARARGGSGGSGGGINSGSMSPTSGGAVRASTGGSGGGWFHMGGGITADDGASLSREEMEGDQYGASGAVDSGGGYYGGSVSDGGEATYTGYGQENYGTDSYGERDAMTGGHSQSQAHDHVAGKMGGAGGGAHSSHAGAHPAPPSSSLHRVNEEHGAKSASKGGIVGLLSRGNIGGNYFWSRGDLAKAERDKSLADFSLKEFQTQEERSGRAKIASIFGKNVGMAEEVDAESYMNSGAGAGRGRGGGGLDPSLFPNGIPLIQAKCLPPNLIALLFPPAVSNAGAGEGKDTEANERRLSASEKQRGRRAGGVDCSLDTDGAETTAPSSPEVTQDSEGDSSRRPSDNVESDDDAGLSSSLNQPNAVSNRTRSCFDSLAAERTSSTTARQLNLSKIPSEGAGSGSKPDTNPVFDWLRSVVQSGQRLGSRLGSCHGIDRKCGGGFAQGHSGARTSGKSKAMAVPPVDPVTQARRQKQVLENTDFRPFWAPPIMHEVKQ